MIGNNSLEFNEATMCAIVEYYLNNVLLTPGNSVKVSSVLKSNATFCVGIEQSNEFVKQSKPSYPFPRD